MNDVQIQDSWVLPSFGSLLNQDTKIERAILIDFRSQRETHRYVVLPANVLCLKETSDFTDYLPHDHSIAFNHRLTKQNALKNKANLDH